MVGPVNRRLLLGRLLVVVGHAGKSWGANREEDILLVLVLGLGLVLGLQLGLQLGLRLGLRLDLMLWGAVR